MQHVLHDGARDPPVSAGRRTNIARAEFASISAGILSGCNISKLRTHFDEIIRQVASGISLTRVLQSNPEFPSKSAFTKGISSDPKLKARYEAVKPLDGLARVGNYFEDIVALVENGASIKDAFLQYGCRDSSFFKYVKQTAGARKRLVSATEKRGGRKASLTPARRYTDAEIDAALVAFAGGASLNGTATAAALYGRAQRNADFRARLLTAVANRTVKRERARPPVSPKGNSHHLANALLRDELFRSVKTAARGFTDADREDVESELYLAILEGELSEKDLRTKIQKPILRRALGQRNRFVSLDAPAFGADDEKHTISDRFASHTEIFHY